MPEAALRDAVSAARKSTGTTEQDEEHRLRINALARDLFSQIVDLPTVSGAGEGVQCPVAGVQVEFSFACARGQIADVPGLVGELAGLVKAEATRVGAVRLHVLTPCTVEPLVPELFDRPQRDVKPEDRTEAEAYWDGLFEAADGSLHSPRPSGAPTNPGWYLDSDLVLPGDSP